jgi:hypothetical protein
MAFGRLPMNDILRTKIRGDREGFDTNSRAAFAEQRRIVAELDALQ